MDVLLDMATHANIGSAHFAPPCGTSSKARERPSAKRNGDDSGRTTAIAILFAGSVRPERLGCQESLQQLTSYMH